METNLEVARRWMNSGLESLFLAEVGNERSGGVTPSTLSSTIDSVTQMPQDILSDITGGRDYVALTALLAIRDLLPGDTEVRELL